MSEFKSDSQPGPDVFPPCFFPVVEEQAHLYPDQAYYESAAAEPAAPMAAAVLGQHESAFLRNNEYITVMRQDGEGIRQTTRMPIVSLPVLAKLISLRREALIATGDYTEEKIINMDVGEINEAFFDIQPSPTLLDETVATAA